MNQYQESNEIIELPLSELNRLMDENYKQGVTDATKFFLTPISPIYGRKHRSLNQERARHGR